MSKKRGFVGYLIDNFSGFLRHPVGLLRPGVVKGYFDGNDFAHFQQMFFDELLLQGFKRTFFQLVLPGQTAGLVKPIPVLENGINECHVRFYKDGRIGCELEVGRWHFNHWVGPRFDDFQLLESILESPFSQKVREYSDKIQELFHHGDPSS